MLQPSDGRFSKGRTAPIGNIDALAYIVYDPRRERVAFEIQGVGNAAAAKRHVEGLFQSAGIHKKGRASPTYRIQRSVYRAGISFWVMVEINWKPGRGHSQIGVAAVSGVSCEILYKG